MGSQAMEFHSRIAWFMAVLFLSPLAMAHSMDPDMEEEVETLDVIEITGTVLEQAPRELSYPLPEIPTHQNLQVIDQMARPELRRVKHTPMISRTLIDQTAKTENILTAVKPLKTERPPYPRRAREQGWHGRVMLRLTIASNGTVTSATIHKGSGYQLLDDSAIQTATQWTFQPAKNGGFPVTSTVNIPIQFDLVQ